MKYDKRGIVQLDDKDIEVAVEKLNRSRQMDAAPILLSYVGMGDKEQAFAWLEKAYSQHSNALTILKVDPLFDPLRSDPRFQALLRRVGLNSL
jgi:hypothetical protein